MNNEAELEWYEIIFRFGDRYLRTCKRFVSREAAIAEIDETLRRLDIDCKLVDSVEKNEYYA